ncbi:Ig-like domain-containing protein, partial [bacterium]|nr:Ig-like domain-containing protein [bacterium]
MANANGNYFEWNNVAATSTGTADIRFRYTNSDGSQRARSCDIYVNTVLAGSYIFPWVNGGWAAWTYSTQVMTVNLNSGNNTIRVQINSVSASSPKVDEMEVVMGAPTIVNVTSVKVNPSNFGIFVGKTATLESIVLPANATDKSVDWASDNTNVVGIDRATGFLTAVAEGTANVTATSTDGAKVGTCTVRVFPLTTTGINPNLILNPGFEDVVPTAYWSDWGNFSTVTSGVATGVNAATVANGLAGGFAQDVTLPVGSAGKTFLFSLKVNTSNAPSSAQAGCKLFEGATELNSPYYVTSTDAVYTTYSWIVATTAATTKAQIWVYKSAAGTIYLDDFSLTE